MTVWSHLVGQQEAIAPLVNATLDPTSMTHAWIITGPPGSGRSEAARAFAAALQCPDNGCGECQVCSTVLGKTHPDVKVFATEKVTITVDEVRDLVTSAHTAPSTGKWRVIIVEDADRMTERTSNVLLKAIEEPPARTVWILCAPSPADISVTLRSRSRSLGLRIPSAEQVAELLIERDGIDPSLALDAAYMAQSHIGIARRLARDPASLARRDQVIAIATDVKGVGDAVLAAADLAAVAEAEAEAVSSARDGEEKEALSRALGIDGGGKIPPSARAQLRELEEEQKRRATRVKRDVLDRAIVDLLSFYRDVALVQNGAFEPFINRRHEGHIRDIAERTSKDWTLSVVDALTEARTRLAGNVQPPPVLEAMVLTMRPER